MTCGIYMIKNKKTGQMYIGQSINIEQRFNEHCKSNCIEDSYIDRAINKHGKNNFNLIIVEKCNRDILNEREKYWIQYYNTYKDAKHYNLSSGGDVFHMSQKTREKMSKNRGNKTGYYRVYKRVDYYGTQNFRWVYSYYKNKRRCKISSKNINILEYKVKSQGLLWKKIFHNDEVEKIKKETYVDFNIFSEKDFFKIAQNTSGYFGVSYNNTTNIWMYKYDNYSLASKNFYELKKKVEAKKLPWAKLFYNENTDKLIKRGGNLMACGKIQKTNPTGVLHLSTCKTNAKQGYTFKYIIEKDGQVIYRKQNTDLFKLKDIITKDGYNWDIQDKQKYNKMINEIEKGEFLYDKYKRFRKSSFTY